MNQKKVTGWARAKATDLQTEKKFSVRICWD